MSITDLNFSGLRRLPEIRAAEAAECGLACMAMVGRYYGHDIDLNGLRQRFSLSLTGATLRHLMQLAEQLSLAPRALRVGLDALGQVRLPAILHWDLNHFVVLKSISRRGAVIHDPARGARKLSMAELSNHFTGVVLELTPAGDFRKATARVSVRLSSLWSRTQGMGAAIFQVLALSLVFQIATFALPFHIQLVVDEAIGRSDRDLLVVLALGFGALTLLHAGLEALRNWVLRLLGSMMSFQIVGNIVRHMIRLPVSFFEKRHVGDIMSRIESTNAIQDALTRGMISAMVDGLMAVIAAAILFLYSPLLGTVVVASLLIVLGLGFAFYPVTRAATEDNIVNMAAEQSHLIETVRAMPTIRLMGGETGREGKWRSRYAAVINSSVRVGKYEITLSFLQSAVIGIQTVLVIYLGAVMILDAQGFSVGMLMAFLSFRQTFSDRALSLVGEVMQFRLLRLHLERLSDIVTAEPDIRDSGAPARMIDVQGAISVRGVSFRYGDASPLVLDDVSLDIEAGDFVAITGPSGGGKTTLSKLLLGVNAPESGQILLDGQPATPELWRAWRSQIGVVAQDDQLLSGSIADNIAFFDPDMDMERVATAAAAAQIHEDILRMPMQYLSLVGDMGSALSGGQRQRVLLARALYRQPRLLLLDEGTANLDEQTESAIADLIAQLPITRIIIAHRPALINRAKRNIRIQNAKITEIQNKHKNIHKVG
ncbi:MAG: peptidase domain-containing ABC transporter [Paracoccus sp. (in: a-proteobacteria)]|uniref:peptidase domain-containing ABC transporter n=1 Tax=Paracoccus sp. TaxID=267 RepID=UPI0026DFB2CE|nr:peptidase domain-containing ABC transporter [Paracoccus sp. (in: a-proteobacteria)]MDO5614014.1 peptidase domain-containing ABC transporter [Paracoccus sp. (in: a-proteobacteria)]